MSEFERYPRGKLNADDEGALTFAVGMQDKTVIITFGQPVAWMGLDKATALDLAAAIRKHAESIR